MRASQRRHVVRGAVPDVLPESPRVSVCLLGKMSGLISLHLFVYQEDIGIYFNVIMYCHIETVLFYVINHES